MGIKRAREIITCARFTTQIKSPKLGQSQYEVQVQMGQTKMAGVAHSKSEARGALGVGLY